MSGPDDWKKDKPLDTARARGLVLGLADSYRRAGGIEDANRLRRFLSHEAKLLDEHTALTARAEAAERRAQEADARWLPEVDALAAIIRRVDGSNRLGAGALAEAIIAALTPEQEETTP